MLTAVIEISTGMGASNFSGGRVASPDKFNLPSVLSNFPFNGRVIDIFSFCCFLSKFSSTTIPTERSIFPLLRLMVPADEASFMEEILTVFFILPISITLPGISIDLTLTSPLRRSR